MVDTAQNLSVPLLLKRQRRERLAGAVGLIAGAVACAVLLVLLTGPLPLVVALAAILCVAAILSNARVGLYLLFFCSLALEQWGIVGLDPVTGRLPFYQNSFEHLKLSPAGQSPGNSSSPDAGRGHRAAPRSPRRGPRARPSLRAAPRLHGLRGRVDRLRYRGRARAGPFDPRAAWEETRSFFYLAIIYLLTCNLIKTRVQLQTFVWLFIAALGLKSVQGIVRYVDVRANGLQVDAITGHEDVVFFAAFVLLVAALLFFGGRLDSVARRQMRAMLAVLPFLIFTLLVTDRRLGFVVLGVGLALVAVLLLRTRRDIFMRLVPFALAGLAIYLVLFWNGTGTLSEPIRAIRSLFAPATARDISSNAWRVLENSNIYYNIRTSPITGLGFGRPYAFVVAEPPLDATGFTYWRFITHNAIYWVWMKMGLIGFIVFWNLIGSAVILGLVTFRRLRDGYLRSLALVVTGVVLMQIVFSYGDLGLTYSRSMLFLGCMLGVLASLPALAEQGEGAVATEDRVSPAPAPASARGVRWPVLRRQPEGGESR